MTAAERKERAARFRYEIARVLKDEAGLNVIRCGGKEYKAIENPVLTKVDGKGVCSIYGFMEVKK